MIKDFVHIGSHASECATDVSQESLALTKSISRFPRIDGLIKAIPANKLEENRRKLKTGFKLFQVKNILQNYSIYLHH